MTGADDWDPLFDPRLVCVVGASADPRRIGGRLVRYSLEAGFTGTIVPVTRRAGEIYGLTTLTDIGDIDAQPDLVVIAVGRDDVIEAVTSATRVGARNIVVVAAGFAEEDASGAALQQSVARLCAESGTRLLGPNSNGIMNVASGAYFAFTPVIDSARPLPGDIAVVTQSAAIGTYFLNHARTVGMGFSHWVHTGNEAGLTALDVTRQLITGGRARAIAMSYEVMRDPGQLRSFLELAAAGDIAIAVLRAGTSPTGRSAAQAHTAALIEDDAGVAAGLLADAGVHVADSIESVMNVLQVEINHRMVPARPRLSLVTTSGGIGVITADAAERNNVDVPAFSNGLQARLSEIAPFCHPRNPVDTTAQTINQPDAFARILSTCLDSGEVDLTAAFIAHGLAGTGDVTFNQVLAAARGRSDGPSAGGLAAIGILSAEACRALQDEGVSVFREPLHLATALGAVGRAREARQRFARRAPQRGAGMIEYPIHGWDEVSAKDLLDRHGQCTPTRVRTTDAPAAGRAAAGIGFPVVAKLVSAAVPHKAAAGALVLNIYTPEQASGAFDQLEAVRATLAPADRQRASIIIEQQLSGIEAFVGCVDHPDYGLIAAIGAGGGGVEDDRRVDWCWQPVDDVSVARAAHRHLRPMPSAEHVAAIGRLARALADLTALTAGLGHPGSVVECNPVVLTGDGAAVAVDALIGTGTPVAADQLVTM